MSWFNRRALGSHAATDAENYTAQRMQEAQRDATAWHYSERERRGPVPWGVIALFLFLLGVWVAGGVYVAMQFRGM